MVIRTLSLTLFILIFPAATVFAQDTPAKTPVTQSEAKKAFAKLKTLSGTWQGTVLDVSINFTVRAVSSGTALLHEGHTDKAGPPKHEITMFYVEGERLLATHYCDGGNRSRWEGKLSADEKAIEFSFIEVTGGTRGGYLKDMVITFIDPDRHVVAFTFVMPDGKPMQFRGEFQRTK